MIYLSHTDWNNSSILTLITALSRSFHLDPFLTDHPDPFKVDAHVFTSDHVVFIKRGNVYSTSNKARADNLVIQTDDWDGSNFCQGVMILGYCHSTLPNLSAEYDTVAC